MNLDYSAVPRMPDGRTALEHIESVAAKSKAIKLPMGNGGKMMWHVWGEDSGKPTRQPTEKLHKLLPEMPAQLLADEARRNLELLMLHDPRNVDGVAIYMQILNTTRARTRSRDMGIAGALSKVLPQVRTPLSGIWGEFDSTTYPYIQERIDIFRAIQPDFVMSVIPGAGHWVAYEAAEAFNAKLLEVLKP